MTHISYALREMNFETSVKESRIQEHSSTICVTRAGKEYLLARIKYPTANTDILRARASHVLALRDSPCSSQIEDLKVCLEAEKILDSHVESDSSKTADAQIQFTGEYTKHLNYIPFLLSIFFILKVYVTPFFALLTPVILFFLPYYMINMNVGDQDYQMPWATYIGIMKSFVIGLEDGQEVGLKHVAQIAYYVFSMGQAVIQPFITAYHTVQVNKAYCRRGEAIQTLYRVGSRLRKHLVSLGIPVSSLPAPPSDIHRVIPWYESTPLIKAVYHEVIGSIDMYCSLASDSAWKPVEWLTRRPVKIEGFHDLAIDSTKAVKNSLDFSGHALLTGPNRGGKSSILRGALQAVLYAQTLGLTRADSYSGSPFQWIHTHLQATDRPGTTSLFEQDVKEASQILNSARTTPCGLVLIDELFHSTNPPDAEISAKQFLGQLWKLRATSLISTHTFSVVRESPSTVRKLCVFAKESDKGVQYTYTLQEGSCFVSSVNEILKEAGVAV